MPTSPPVHRPVSLSRDGGVRIRPCHQRGWRAPPTVWFEWLEARATRASTPEVWLKRYPAVVGQRQGNTHHTDITTIPPSDLSHLADRIRALMVRNDPDAVRAGSVEIAAALDTLRVRDDANTEQRRDVAPL